MKNTICAVFFCIASAAATAGADTLPAPRDIPFKGEIKLSVDATDQVHKILRVRQTIPVQGGRKMVLMYPQWETDSHSATQELTGLAGLIVKAGASIGCAMAATRTPSISTCRQARANWRWNSSSSRRPPATC
ncbi:hypothetical protein NHH88_02165 [Oxalobacteraceae bacterium OTU3CAMAD1]|nr:hypothetical protein NHH88_02165 [Oxalobacteraceae bacterium OTU3CAMAD1]